MKEYLFYVKEGTVSVRKDKLKAKNMNEAIVQFYEKYPEAVIDAVQEV